eukprot:m.332725 g.332725  ORF g.332725 m.332725 type:complete len:884 (-) comp16996_c0_seq1:287-2938(-)
MDSPRKSFGGGGGGPTGMPTVFGDEFKGAGQKEGIECWRIEKLKCVKKLNVSNPKDTPPNAGQLAHAGKLCSGDSYIFLHTKQKNGGASMDRKIYYWRGSESSQDEYGTMAYKAVELDESLGGEPSQHREVQGHETEPFKALFKAGVSYIEGGVATGFKSAAEATKHKNRLLHVKGKRNVTVRQVEYNPSSMNVGDVFILDLGDKIYQWNGKECSRMEKQKAMDATRAIRDQERSGKASVFIVDQDSDNSKDLEAKFWEDFGHSKQNVAAATDDAAHEQNMVKEVKLYHLSDASGSMKQEEITDRPLKKDMLDTNDAYILNTGPSGIFAWVGKGATKAEKTAAMTNAEKFLKENNLPDWTPIARLVEGGETPIFKQFFAVWPEPVSEPLGAPGQRRSTFVKKVFDPNSMHAKRAKEQARLPQEMEGSGELSVFRIENIKDLAPVKKNEYGQFYAGDSYVILYKYKTPGGKESAFIYFWQGLKSTQDEKAASAIQAKNMDDEMGGYPVQVRVVMNKEPPHFYKIFANTMIVHAGGIGSGFKNVDQADEYDTDGVRLFHVRGTNDYNTRAVQVPERAASLNSGDCFILETPEQLYIWNGRGCSGDEREFAKRAAPRIHGLASKNRDPETVLEGNEPEGFWKAIGEDPEKIEDEGRPEYGKIDYGDAGSVEARDPRLFHCTDARGYFWAEEIYDFDQEDLIPEDCMILDTYAEVYVWLGEEAKDNEKKDAMELAKKFVESAPERNVDDTTFLVIKQGMEPPTFTCHFIGWDDDKWRNGKTYEELRAEMMAANPSGEVKDLAVNLDDAVAKYTPGGTIYPYKDLAHKDWKKRCEGVQPDSREQHLSDEEFGQHFKKPGADGEAYTKAEFLGLPKWKQANMKKKVKLF